MHYSPFRRSTRSPKEPFALDLHVLAMPPAFVLSQDQTLQLNVWEARRRSGDLDHGLMLETRRSRRVVAPPSKREVEPTKLKNPVCMLHEDLEPTGRARLPGRWIFVSTRVNTSPNGQALEGPATQAGR